MMKKSFGLDAIAKIKLHHLARGRNNQTKCFSAKKKNVLQFYYQLFFELFFCFEKKMKFCIDFFFFLLGLNLSDVGVDISAEVYRVSQYFRSNKT